MLPSLSLHHNRHSRARPHPEDGRGDEGTVLPGCSIKGPKEKACEFSLNTAKESRRQEKREQGEKKQAVDARVAG